MRDIRSKSTAMFSRTSEPKQSCFLIGQWVSSLIEFNSSEAYTYQYQFGKRLMCKLTKETHEQNRQFIISMNEGEVKKNTPLRHRLSPGPMVTATAERSLSDNFASSRAF
jgi:hypothetical protein